MKKLVLDLISEDSINLKEKILVVKSSALPKKEGAFGETPNELYRLIKEHGSYQLRNNELEANPAFRQVTPYVVVKCGNKYLYSARTAAAGEKRLSGKGLVGFGGHTKAEDVEGREMTEWGLREINEELDIRTNLKSFKFAGLIIDNSEEVSLVHLGVLIVAEAETTQLQIREKDKFVDPIWLTKKELREYYPTMEGWSRLALESGLV